MVPGERLPADDSGEQRKPTDAASTLNPPQDFLPDQDLVSRGNSSSVALINTQPLPASQDAAETKAPTCPRCGLSISDHRLAPAPQNRAQGSSLSVHSSSSSSISRRKRKRRKNRRTGSHQPANSLSNSCLDLLLACLSCQCSALLLGLLETCSSCLHGLCSSCCCRGCGRCCAAAVREAPVEELNCHVHCHSVLFESCCEPTECLEFCLECCEICHRS